MYSHQKRIHDHVLTRDRGLVWAPPGVGKTRPIIESMDGSMRCLVVAPTNVARYVWAQEIAKWRPDLDVAAVYGTGMSPKKRTEIIRCDKKWSDVVVLPYSLMSWFAKNIGKDHDFEMLVFDECDKLKSWSSRRFKDFYKIIDSFPNRYGMTGTPASEGLIDLFAQSKMILGPGVLGNSIEHLRQEWFYEVSPDSYKWVPRRGAKKWFTERLAPHTCVIDWADVDVVFPKLQIVDHYFELDKKARALYDDFERDFILHLPDTTLEAPSLAVLSNKLRQICNGFSYQEGRDEHWHHKQKFEWLDSLISQLQGAQLLVVYAFNAERRLLRDTYKGRIGFIGGDQKRSDSDATIRAWNSGKLQICGIHPSSAGHGLNLQESGAHQIAFLGLPWSSRLFIQTLGRLRRNGQENIVVAHRILAKNTVDEHVAAALHTKETTERSIHRALMRALGA